MTSANIIGMLFGVALITYGIFDKRNKRYNEVEAPLREEERLEPPRPFSRRERISLIGFGLLLVILAIMGKFSG